LESGVQMCVTASSFSLHNFTNSIDIIAQ
jgi:hypothetical protein